VKLDTGFLPFDADVRVRPGLMPIAAVGLAVALVLALFWQTAWSMVSMWIKSDTFTHGFVIAPIAIWLVWRQREALAQLPARPFLPGLALLAAAGFVWLLGDIASVNVIAQLALVAMIQLAVVTVVGLNVARMLIFPLAFLLFLAPVGEFLIPPFIDWTADFTTLAVKWSGVPIFREGNEFVIPSGRWSVVAGCSGVRYLIASFMVGLLFAHLTYRSMWRKGAFVLASILVPIVANWLRAYMIVMLGHLSDNRLAAGVDHLVYGWLFFGIVIGLMFWIGSFWREDGPSDAPKRTPQASSYLLHPAASAPALFAVAGLVVLVAAAWKPLAIYLDSRVQTAPVVLSLPTAGGSWSASDAPFTDWRPVFTGARATTLVSYTSGTKKVGVYVAYYRSQAQDAELVNSTNLLVTPKDHIWHVLSRGTTLLAWPPSGNLAADSATLKSRVDNLSVRQWYWVNSNVTSSAYMAKLLLAWSKLLGRGDDSAAIILFAPFAESPEQAEPVLQEFARDMGKSISDSLVRAGERGMAR
jgi:exosortase A